MKYLLDTNVWIDYLTGRFPEVVERVQAARPDDIAMSAVVLAELRYGAEKSRRRGSNHERVDRLAESVETFAFDDAGARAYGEIRNDLEKRGKPLGPNDLMIAAHARSSDLTLVTDNENEFRRVRGLRVENWRKR